ncbi:uncharacterized protein METZ01_LOCUS102165, partial [marine metagenome]
LLGVNTRRTGENIWLRINELVMPNFTQAGSAFAADGSQVRYYGRSSFSRWVVPLDDENTVCFAWANFGDRGDPEEWNTPDGPELIEQGEVFERSYDERQRSPADVEAVEGMGAITVHENENLVISDKGIALMRRLLRDQIRSLASGGRPLRARANSFGSIPTYGGDTVLRMPRESADSEAEELSALAHRFMKIQYQVDDLAEEERIAAVTECLKELEVGGMSKLLVETAAQNPVAEADQEA